MGSTLLVGGAAYGAIAASPLVVAVTGTASGGVSLSGTATIESKLVPDEFGGPPSHVVSIRLSNVTGHNVAGIPFQGSGEGVALRPAVGSDTVEISVAVGPAGAIPVATRTAKATFALTFDPATGAPLTATGVFAPSEIALP